MNNFWRVLKLRTAERADYWKIRYSFKTSDKIGIWLYRLIRIGMFGLLFAGIYKVYDLMALAGIAEVLPTMSYFMASLACVFVTIISMNEILTGNEDSEFLLSTPIHEFVHVAVIFLFLYTKCIVYVGLISLPAAIVYMRYVAGFAFFKYWLVGALLTSLPLGGISCLAGTVILLTLAHHPKKEQIQSVITMFFIGSASALVLYIVNQMDTILKTASQNTETVIHDTLALFVTNFRFSRLYQYAIVEHSTGYLIVFIILSVIWYAVFCFAFGMGYRVVVISFRCPVDYKTYSWKTQKQVSASKACFRREMQQLIRSKSYMTRTLTGLIIGLIVSLSMLLFKNNILAVYLNERQFLLLSCFFVGLANSTYCAFSMEGKRNWITNTSPMDERDIRISKIKANLVFTLPFSALNGIMLVWAVKPAWLMQVFYLMIPAMYAVLNAYWGIWMDTKYGSYEKESEDMIMHQGLSYVLGYLPGVVLPIVGILAF